MAQSVVWIARHAERQDYVDPYWVRSAAHPDDPPLAEKGRRQALELAERLRHEPVDAIISSPFQRCVETASIVAEAVGATIKIEPGICEVLWDYPPGYLPVSELKRRFPRIDDTYRPALVPEGEEAGDVECIRRSATAARLVRDSHPGNLLFVGHGASVAGIIKSFAGRPVYVGLCTLSKLVEDEEKQWRVEFVGDPGHLSDKTNLRAY